MTDQITTCKSAVDKIVYQAHYAGRRGLQLWTVVDNFAPQSKDPLEIAYWFNAVKYLLRYHRKTKRELKEKDLRKCYTYVDLLLGLIERERNERRSNYRPTTGAPQAIPKDTQVPGEFLGAPIGRELAGSTSAETLPRGKARVYPSLKRSAPAGSILGIALGKK